MNHARTSIVRNRFEFNKIFGVQNSPDVIKRLLSSGVFLSFGVQLVFRVNYQKTFGNWQQAWRSTVKRAAQQRDNKLPAFLSCRKTVTHPLTPRNTPNLAVLVWKANRGATRARRKYST